MSGGGGLDAGQAPRYCGLMDSGWRTSSHSTNDGQCVEWRKSSRSLLNGNCLEWRTSSRSAENGNCVEVAGCRVRDSKDRAGPVLAFPRAAWQAFTAGIKAGELCWPEDL